MRVSSSIPGIIIHRCLLSMLLCLLFSMDSAAQKSSRILFMLDASGSMKGQWHGTSKFDLAKKILAHTVDSFSNTGQPVEFGLRVFGHQSPRDANDCSDSKLEVPFSPSNAQEIRESLNRLRPQGQTPITFALEQSLNDFPDSLATNAIVLITDGNETCSGNLCDLASKFAGRRITLRPYIVGLGLNDSLQKKFECIGEFYNVQNEDMFSGALRVIISRVLNPTTCQINLLDAYGKPTMTNFVMSLYDHRNGNVLYRLIHTQSASGIPDTLILHPQFVYDLEVHSIPPVRRNDIEMVQGQHNIIAVEIPAGTLDIRIEGTTSTFSNLPCVIRNPGSGEILYVQDANTSQRYLKGFYDIEILTLPPVKIDSLEMVPSSVKSIKVPRAGTLTVTPSSPGVAGIFMKQENELRKIYDLGLVKTQKSISLQPGKYILIYRPDKNKQAEATKEIPFQLSSGRTSSLRW